MPSTMDSDSQFIDWLQQELHKREWTKQRLAEKAGVHSAVIVRIMNRDVGLGADVARKIADALGVSQVEVFHRAGLIDASWLFDDKDYLMEIRRGLSRIEDEDEREQVIYIIGTIVSSVAARQKGTKTLKVKPAGKSDLARGKA